MEALFAPVNVNLQLKSECSVTVNSNLLHERPERTTDVFGTIAYILFLLAVTWSNLESSWSKEELKAPG